MKLAALDIAVCLDSSRLRNQADHVMVPSGHNGLLVRPAAIRQVIGFLNEGRFQEESSDVGLSSDV